MKKKSFFAIQRALIRCQEIGDEKLTLLSVIIDFIENRTRQLEQDRENLGKYCTCLLSSNAVSVRLL